MTRNMFSRVFAILAMVIGGMLVAYWISGLFVRTNMSTSTDQVGLQLLREDRAYDAALVFEDPVWKGVALFHADRFQRAAASFSLQDSVMAQYNLGVSYAYLKRYRDAEITFIAVLAREPDHADARHNLTLLRRLGTKPKEQDQAGQSADQGGERKKAEDSGGDDAQNNSMAAPNLTQDQAESSSEESKRDVSQINPEDASDTQLGGAGSQEKRADLLKQLQEREPGQAKNAEDSQEENDEAGRGSQEQPAEETELAIAEQVRFRQVVDRPEVVLRARLRAAASIRKGSVEATK